MTTNKKDTTTEMTEEEIKEEISHILENLIGEFNSGGNIPAMTESRETNRLYTLFTTQKWAYAEALIEKEVVAARPDEQSHTDISALGQNIVFLNGEDYIWQKDRIKQLKGELNENS